MNNITKIDVYMPLNLGQRRKPSPPRNPKDRKGKHSKGKTKGGHMRKSNSSPGHLHSVQGSDDEGEENEAELHSLSIQVTAHVHVLGVRTWKFFEQENSFTV